ncbi:ATP-binding cassette domain-containing protein [Patulibacter sp. SYSU D01012]|uniref:ABC transporter ATP-binding protein n=1 Tax=Patulibacter sp. SYSU D01012 TaxID=2817381 RepID=UPI001B30A59D|nr:ATP-binding cassette domain-containing protein [Patulibacter sp. SYSU D01012]
MSAVGKRYGRRAPWVLRDVDATFAAGAIVRVAGPNGCGKSTLLRVLAGASRATKGRVRRAGRCVGFAADALPPGLPLETEAYLRHMAAIAGVRASRDGDRSARLVDGFGLRGMVGRRLGELSKGTAHKVSLSVALAAPARLFVLDEPWSGLDEASQAFLVETLAALRRDGACVVFTDHGERTAGLGVDDDLVLEDGRLRAGRATPSAPQVVIVLRSDAHMADTLRALRGVRAVREAASGGRYDVVTDAEHSDQVLLACVTDGAHVVSVRQEGAAR